MLLHLREDDQGGGPHLKDIFWAHRLKGLFGAPHLEGVLRAQDQGLGCPGFGHNGNTCKSPVSTVLSGLMEASKIYYNSIDSVTLCPHEFPF